MKLLTQSVALATLLAVFQIGCERHDFDDTKGLHMEHGKHHEDHGESEGHADPTEGDGHEKKESEKKESASEEPRATGL